MGFGLLDLDASAPPAPAFPLGYTGGHEMAIANWKNQTIWTGDKLDIMRGMNSESVDLVYLDPPFNPNKTYSAPIGSKAAGAAFTAKLKNMGLGA